uniref:GDT1 family protein n=1 Tax=Coccolithus braarudii TaxID=221442 RepID=A0A7S0L2A7_9EUKA|mmetsp:Transcript_1349/g.2914  ORF Transcript_1349/g.2914 Transcript_1349/m.2914 type:complete len:264 (+) Transcript_1349:6-797(+)
MLRCSRSCVHRLTTLQSRRGLISPTPDLVAPILQPLAQLSSSGTLDGVCQSALLVGASELGDKTFFLSAIIAMREGRIVAFTGSMAALSTLTAASVALGAASRQLPPEVLVPYGIPVVDVAATATLTYFGIQMLRHAPVAVDAAHECDAEASAEAAAALSKRSGVAGALGAAFMLVFIAEVGDKSMVSTVALARDFSAGGVMLGAMAGHTAATGLAVAGGHSLSGYLSPATVHRVGGALFLLFAALTAAKAAGVVGDDADEEC